MDIVVLLVGIFYGIIIGLIPSVGATTGLVALFPFIHYFADSPYRGVIFCVSMVAASTTGDTFSGILLGIPGANSAAATMVDGFPLALKGRATYALSAAFTASTINGLIWGGLTFLLLPYYAHVLLFFGIPELLLFTILAFATVGFISSKYWIRSLIALAVGIFLGLVGLDTNASPRFTFGWKYLFDGIQLIPVVAGLFAIPELVDSLVSKTRIVSKEKINCVTQGIEGIKVVFKNWRLALSGGIIGAIIGILPGLGGAIADWLAYGNAVASNPNEKFGDGNIKGIIGCEGANNAQKASSFIPTVLFGIPGAPFAAVLMSLFMYLNFEMGSIDLLNDKLFFDYLSYSFLISTALTGILCLFLCRYISYILYIPYKYYIPLLMGIIVLASMQYTGGWEDFILLLLMSLLGFTAKYYKFSRPSLLVGFILADRVEKLSVQTFSIYSWRDLFHRPGFIILLALIVLVAFAGLRNNNRLHYT